MASEERRVLIAVDGSQASEKAFDWFVNNLYHKGDHVVVIHASELHLPALPNAIMSEEWKIYIQDHEKNIKDLEEKYKRKCQELPAPSKILVVGGSPGEQICKKAKEENFTMVVMGSRGTGTLRRTILGSVSDYVIHHAHIPVIVCPRKH